METTPANTTAATVLPHLWKATLVSGLLSVLLGVLIVAWPGPTLGQAIGAVVQDDLADLQGLLEPGARGRAQAHCLCGAP